MDHVVDAESPEVALTYLGRLNSEIRAAVIVDGDGRLCAHSGEAPEDGEELAALAHELLERADEGHPDIQVEVASGAGAVFALREDGWALAVVARRAALSSLLFYDLRSTLARVKASAA